MVFMSVVRAEGSGGFRFAILEGLFICLGVGYFGGWIELEGS